MAGGKEKPAKSETAGSRDPILGESEEEYTDGSSKNGRDDAS